MQLKVGIINVTGYAGSELARILYRHPTVTLSSVTGRSSAGKKLKDVFPHLSKLDLVIQSEIDPDMDIIFSALPHKASAEAILPFIEGGTKIIDISADFRLKDPNEYELWYNVPHPGPKFLNKAVYGLTELSRKDIGKAQLIANPGCYSTAAILALAPVIKEGIVNQDIIVDGKSGLSGAGRNPGPTTHFSEVNENVMGYSVNGHRHLPEMQQELEKLMPTYVSENDRHIDITFVPHLIPMTRGILNSCYASIKQGYYTSPDRALHHIRDLYNDFYSGEPFITIASSPPQTKQTLGSNQCILYPTVDERSGKLIVISCLDNLVKGAAGQAVQNMNLMLGIPEPSGLEELALYP